MASIEYGIDVNGEKVYANNGIKGRIYICPYCLEEIEIRKQQNSSNRVDFFAHRKNSNRTPQQRICPGYTGDINNKINTKTDSIYISNGGVPLYLINFIDEKYILQARFPHISMQNEKLLNQWNVKVKIIEERLNQKAIYNVSNLKYYKIKSMSQWIEVKCENMKEKIDEVSQKWEWGIRGISLNNDLFHSNNSGGYRVAQHSNIVINKEYLFITEKNRFNVNGIKFKFKGNITLASSRFISKDYKVFSLKVTHITNESIAYIQQKGYQLIEKNDEIIPLWPPSIIEGKEIYYKSEEEQAYLYHSKIPNQQIHSLSKRGLLKVNKFKNIINVSTLNNTLILSDYKFNILSNDIRYILNCGREKYYSKEKIGVEVKYKDKNYNDINLEEKSDKLFNNEKIFLESSLPMKIIIGKENYVQYSSTHQLDINLTYNKIIVDFFSYGYIKYIKQKPKDLKKEGNMDYDLLVKTLYKCNSALIGFDKKYLKILDFAKVYNMDLYKIVFKWSIIGKMPYRACKYLDNIMGAINNETK